MSRATIRRARMADLEPLVQLERLFPSDNLSRRSFRHLLTRAHADVWVCVRAERMIGNAVVLYRAGSRSARLYSVVIDPAERGRGIARDLVKRAHDAARRRCCTQLHLEVRPDNTAAIRLYRKLGYRETRRIARFYEDGADALRFEATLAARRRAHTR